MTATKPVDTLHDYAGAYPRSGRIAASTSRTASEDFGDIDCVGAGGIVVYVEVTSLHADTPSITVTIQGVTPDGTAYTLLASAAIAATGLTRLRVAPSLTAVANAAANDLVPDKVRIHVVNADAKAIDYTISAVLTPEG